MELCKKQALQQRRKYSMTRHGLHWINGHACKTGPPQAKLTTFLSPAVDTAHRIEVGKETTTLESISVDASMGPDAKKKQVGKTQALSSVVAQNHSSMVDTRSLVDACPPPFVDTRVQGKGVTKRGSSDCRTEIKKIPRFTQSRL